MMKYLANENVPPEAIEAVRRIGLDITWIKDICPGADDDSVLGLAYTEDRVLVTFDKDFGEMAFLRGKTLVPGVILLRPRLRGAEYLAQFVAAILSQSIPWEGHFCVAREGRMRVVPMPE